MAFSKLKFLRMSNGMTQFDLAQKLGVSEKLISWWETGRGEPGTDTCFRISRILNTDVSELWPERFSSITNRR